MDCFVVRQHMALMDWDLRVQLLDLSEVGLAVAPSCDHRARLDWRVMTRRVVALALPRQLLFKHLQHVIRLFL